MLSVVRVGMDLAKENCGDELTEFECCRRNCRETALPTGERCRNSQSSKTNGNGHCKSAAPSSSDADIFSIEPTFPNCADISQLRQHPPIEPAFLQLRRHSFNISWPVLLLS